MAAADVTVTGDAVLQEAAAVLQVGHVFLVLHHLHKLQTKNRIVPLRPMIHFSRQMFLGCSPFTVTAGGGCSSCQRRSVSSEASAASF